jgi:hypothetical protein
VWRKSDDAGSAMKPKNILRRTWYRLDASLILIVLVEIASPLPVFAEEFTFRVHYDNRIVLRNADVDGILADATRIFQDEHCDVVLSRCGVVQRSAMTYGIIDTNAKFMALKPAQPGNTLREVSEAMHTHVFVVRAITFCGGRIQPPTTTLGCTMQGSNWMVVADPYRPVSNKLNAIVWAHEFGHTRGLVNLRIARRLMTSPSSLVNTKLDAGECRKILTNLPGDQPASLGNPTP